MKIKKHGHCCFVAEPKPGVRIMTDPGSFSTSQNEEKNISALLITHEHADHLHVDSVKAIIKNNPGIPVITNSAVGKILEKEGIAFIKVEDGESHDHMGVHIVGFGNDHAEIYESYGLVQNTGFMIDSLAFPGDAFTVPKHKVDILALPLAGPWVLVKFVIDYAKAVKPRIAFPVHDATLSPAAAFVSKTVEHFLSEDGIVLKALELGKEEEV